MWVTKSLKGPSLVMLALLSLWALAASPAGAMTWNAIGAFPALSTMPSLTLLQAPATTAGGTGADGSLTPMVLKDLPPPQNDTSSQSSGQAVPLPSGIVPPPPPLSFMTSPLYGTIIGYNDNGCPIIAGTNAPWDEVGPAGFMNPNDGISRPPTTSP